MPGLMGTQWPTSYPTSGRSTAKTGPSKAAGRRRREERVSPIRSLLSSPPWRERQVRATKNASGTLHGLACIKRLYAAVLIASPAPLQMRRHAPEAAAPVEREGALQKRQLPSSAVERARRRAHTLSLHLRSWREERDSFHRLRTGSGGYPQHELGESDVLLESPP